MVALSSKLGLSTIQSVAFAFFVLVLSVGIVLFAGFAQWEDLINANWKNVPYLSTIIKVSVAIIVIGWIYIWLSKPLVVKFAPDTVEKIPNGKLLARAQRSRKSGKIPPPYPTGWFKIADSFELAKGEVKYIEFFNEHLALYRGENGVAAILDAYCPHLGANIAVTGKVVGNCIQCPFHGWEFKEDGKCVSIPYLDKVPDLAKTRAWPVIEKNQTIYMYYDMLGRLDQPAWVPPDIPQIMDGSFIFHGSFENYVEAHIQEIPENGSDVAHLGVLHVPFIIGWIPFMSHHWTAVWTAGEAPEEHIANIKLTTSLVVFGKIIPFTSVDAKIRQIGPGIVNLEIITPLGSFIVMESVTPMYPLLQRVSHVMYAKKGFFARIQAQILLRSFCEQFCRDVVIWNNKTYVNKPLIVKNDGNILGFRRWYAKFYPDPEELKKYQETNQRDLSW